MYLKRVKWVMKVHEKCMFNIRPCVSQTKDIFSSEIPVNAK